MLVNRSISYEMRLVNTEAVTGYFSCEPLEQMTLPELFDILTYRPMDTFLHRHTLNVLCSLSIDKFSALIQSTIDCSLPVQSVYLEAAIINPAFLELIKPYYFEDASNCSPLVNLRSLYLPDREVQSLLISTLRDNIVLHRPLTSNYDHNLSMLRSNIIVHGKDSDILTHVNKIYSDSFLVTHEYPRRIVSATGAAKMAAEKLESSGVFVEAEMRHVSSLSPIALLRKWKLERSVDSDRNKYKLTGIHTAYGKGLSLEDARASCVMEVLERYCSYASVKSERIVGCQKDYSLIRSSFSDTPSLSLDPSSINLEIPYRNEPLWWMPGEQISSDGTRTILVPVQMVYLFSNLDEIDLFSGLGSTGLAAHTNMANAKNSALLECIERDCDSISIFDKTLCFKISTNDPELAPLFSAYAARGIHIQFQDISNEMGIPCYRCFVEDESGLIVKGTGANLSAKKALLSALLETPYPFPYGKPSGNCFDNLSTIVLEDLPDYSTENPYQDLYILEQTLVSNGFAPVYVDLTRKDMEFPVVKAIIPGLEIMNDFDAYSRVSPRMAANYIKAISK